MERFMDGEQANKEKSDWDKYCEEQYVHALKLTEEEVEALARYWMQELGDNSYYLRLNVCRSWLDRSRLAERRLGELAKILGKDKFEAAVSSTREEWQKILDDQAFWKKETTESLRSCTKCDSSLNIFNSSRGDGGVCWSCRDKVTAQGAAEGTPQAAKVRQADPELPSELTEPNQEPESDAFGDVPGEPQT